MAPINKNAEDGEKVISKVDEIFRKIEYTQEQEIYKGDITKGDITKLVPSQVIIKKKRKMGHLTTLIK